MTSMIGKDKMELISFCTDVSNSISNQSESGFF